MFCALLAACGGGTDKPKGMTQCSDGVDNDSDGLVDFPDDPGCTSLEDDSEDSLPMPQCSDGRDNDGDGKIDFPDDPGCFAPQQDSETDDCPNGPNCPQCGNGKDDDGNGTMDYPNDPGCASASDNDEFTDNPVACGQAVTIKHMPATNEDTGMFTLGAPSNLSSTQCGGTGGEIAYELRITQPKVIVASTDNAGTTADTVLYIRSKDCMNAAMELACSDDLSSTNTSSTITQSLTPGVYYLIVDAHDTSTNGAYDLTVHFFVGEGVTCATGDDCGPGLVCRVPMGGTMGKVCSKHVCSDGVDDDGDGKLDYPTDPGCAAPDDDDETDDCPNGPNCPECANGKDDDMDGKTDYPADLQCKAASSTSEACVSHENVAEITTGITMGDTSMGAANDFTLSCGFEAAPDLTYRLDLPKMASLSIVLDSATIFPEMELLNSSCGGTELACSSSSITETNFAAGTYYLVVQSDFASELGPFTVTVSGQIAGGESCESPLAQANAITCASGFACAGTAGSRTCKPAKCNNGIDDDSDGKIDYPNDPGCTSPSDDDESDTCPGAGCPVCSDGMDNDGDMLTDYPADYGCASAAGTSEVFCTGETDPTSLVTMPVTTGTTVGKANDFAPTCVSSSTSPDVALALSLPVPVASLQVDTIGSAFDTVLSIKDSTCGTTIACDDDSGNSTAHTSKITLSNVAPGNYAIDVDGYLTHSDVFTLNVKGTVAQGTSCTSNLFTTGLLVCPTGTTCKGTPKTCAP